ncbi:WD40-repeat-containing domain protein [Catenaria anguillulae PL171]|uniref:WD40 repeat-containing protein SMU1 n=1 Tax=Catenaria anguillulae PL171 TaxID=765915 RepID=A0A1Y2HYI2_9FUNG|nr:WD40-repeat-containing domain protein [Catenaria anguillulae PL171]
MHTLATQRNAMSSSNKQSLSAASQELELPAADILKLVAQFLKEHNLHHTLHALQSESNSHLCNIDDHAAFRSAILDGHWDAVLQAVQSVDLPLAKRQSLLEHVFLELIELRQLAAAKILLHQTDTLLSLRDMDPDRYAHLENLLHLVDFHANLVYGDVSKQARREHLAQSLLASLGPPIPPSRLLTLISQGLKFQAQHDPSFAPVAGAWDVLRDAAPSLFAHNDVDAPVSHQYATLALAQGQTVESVAIAPNGQWIATGSTDGIIEVWHPVTGKLRMDLEYQAKDKFMAMNTAVLALAWAKDSSMLVSGAQDGGVKVWQLGTGKCIKRISKAHAQGVTCVALAGDWSVVVSGGFDAMIRTHGMQSGTMLKEFRGHTSFVNSITFNSDESKLFSGSSDGHVKIWDAKTGVCMKTLAPTAPHNLSVFHLHWLASRGHLQIGTRAQSLLRVDVRGTPVVQVACAKELGPPVNEPVAAATSPQGEYAYLVTESGTLATVYVRAKSVTKVELGMDKVIGVTACAGPMC